MKNSKTEIRKHRLPFRKTNLETFLLIKKGIKKIETRGGGPKYNSIKDGDILVLVCGEKRIEKKIKKVRKFKTIEGLFKKYPMKIVMPNCKNLKEAKEIYYKYPGYKERLKKFGLLAFEL